MVRLQTDAPGLQCDDQYMAAGGWSVLLSLMAAIVALLSSHLFVAWIRRSQGYLRTRDVVGPALLSAASLAVGLSSAMVLALATEPLAFPLGYRWPALPVLLFGAMLGCLPAAWWLTRRQNLLALMGAGLLISVVSLSVQTGWILAAGFRPGPSWNLPLASGAGILAVVGYTASMWLAYSDRSGHGVYRTLWRQGASMLLVITMVASQEVLIAAAGLGEQVGSVYQHELSSAWLALGAGAVVPTLMSLLVLDVVLRHHGNRRKSRHSPTGLELDLPKSRKRRRRYRTL